MYYSEKGDELKKFNTRDGMAFALLRDAGIRTGIITSEVTEMVARRARKLQLDYCCQGVFGREKLDTVREICSREGIGLDEVAYIGDDINCYELLSAVGLPACPADAQEQIRTIPGILHLKKRGGEGMVREFVEKLVDTH
jgi:YrbI family 3-deoxy-D-manno-octulosonate 8-phosphate phosphatase